MSDAKYGIEYDFGKAEDILKVLTKLIKEHDKSVEALNKTIVKFSKIDSENTEKRVKGLTALEKAQKKREEASSKEAKQVLKVRAEINKLNKETRDQIKLSQAEETIKNTQIKSINDLAKVTNSKTRSCNW